MANAVPSSAVRSLAFSILPSKLKICRFGVLFYEPGLGRVVDDFGIDWWDVISLLLHEELQQVRLALRLAERLRRISGAGVNPRVTYDRSASN